jgi:hypothetical protein
MDDDMEPEKLKEILSVVSTEIPKLVEAITKTMYNAENAENMAKAVAQFYKSMKDAGMAEDQAFALTQDFMSSFSIGGMIGKAIQGHGHDDGVDDLIEATVREKIKKKLEKESGEDD